MDKSTKNQRVEVKKVLKDIWLSAYKTGETILEYPPADELACRTLYYALADYRKGLRKKPLENAQLLETISRIALKKRLTSQDSGESKFLTIVLTLKPAKGTNTTSTVLETLGRFPEVFLEKPPLTQFLVDFE